MHIMSSDCNASSCFQNRTRKTAVRNQGRLDAGRGEANRIGDEDEQLFGFEVQHRTCACNIGRQQRPQRRVAVAPIA